MNHPFLSARPLSRQLLALAQAHPLFCALRTIADRWPSDAPAPEPEDYHDTESAYGNGEDVSTYESAEIARSALAAYEIMNAGAIALLAEACEAWRDSFEHDTEINGGDMVEWFSGWREKAKAVLAGQSGATNPAADNPVQRAHQAVALLRKARDLLAGAPRAQDRVRAALRSAEGAVRNAQSRAVA